MEGLYQQIQKSNTYKYKPFSLQALKEALDEIYTNERTSIRKELDELTDRINAEQFKIIYKLLYSELNEDYTLAKEIINNLKNN